MLSYTLFHFFCFSLKMKEPASVQIYLLKFIKLSEEFLERDVFLMAPAVYTLVRSKLYCSSNGMTSLMKNTSCFLKNVLLCKGHVKYWKYVSYFTHGSDRFGLWYILLPASKVLLLVQDQNEIFPGANFHYSWCLNEQKW